MCPRGSDATFYCIWGTMREIMYIVNAWSSIAKTKHRKSAKLPDITILNSLFGLFVFLSGHHFDQMSEGSQVSKVALCVEILKWQWVSDWRQRPRVGIELPGQLKIIKAVHKQASGSFPKTFFSNMNVAFQDARDACNWKWNLWKEVWGSETRRDSAKQLFLHSHPFSACCRELWILVIKTGHKLRSSENRMVRHENGP